MEEKYFDKHICEMKSWFSQSRKTQTRKNSKQLKLEKLNFLVRVSYVAKVEKGVPLVVLKSIGKIVYDNFYLLYINEELEHLFTPGSMVCFRSSRNINSYLVRAKLYPVERSVGSFNCKRPRCLICAYVNETDSFTSTVTRETYKINHRFDISFICLLVTNAENNM